MTTSRIASHAEKVAHYQKRLHAIASESKLIYTLQQNFPDTKNFQVLSLGCGDDPIEAKSLQDLFKEEKLTIRYVGVDVDKNAIQKCQQDFKSDKNCMFKIIDGTDFRKIATLAENEKFHLIVARHPVFVFNSPAMQHFQYIFSTTVPYLLFPGGTLIASLYGKDESETFKEVISTVSDNKPIALAEDQTALAEYDPRPTAFGGKIVACYADRFVLAYTNFMPILANQIEQLPAPSSSDTTILNNLLLSYTKESGGKTAKMNVFLETFTQDLASLSSKKESLTEKLSHVIGKATSEECKVNLDSFSSHPLERISWNIIKRLDSTTLHILLTQVSHLALHLLEKKPENFAKEFEKGLIMLGKRPLMSDLFSEKSTEKVSHYTKSKASGSRSFR